MTSRRCTGIDAAIARRRSVLSVPGGDDRKLTKATGLAVDEIVIDLEDSVLPAAKPAALAAAVSALEAWEGPAVAVRVNAPGTPWCHNELIALAAARRPPGSVVVPKVQSSSDLAFVDRLLDGVEAAAGDRPPLDVQVLIESAACVAGVAEIACGSPRLRTLIIGYADLGASLGRTASARDRPELWLSVQDAVLAAARSYGLQAIDGPYLSTADDAPFRHAATHARDLGFDGKWAIHPTQTAALNELFTPTGEDIAHAQAVIEALRTAQESGSGAVALDGEMLDEAMRRAALRILARAGVAG